MHLSRCQKSELFLHYCSWSYENEVSFQMEPFHVTRINGKYRGYFSFDFRKL